MAKGRAEEMRGDGPLVPLFEDSAAQVRQVRAVVESNGVSGDRRDEGQESSRGDQDAKRVRREGHQEHDPKRIV